MTDSTPRKRKLIEVALPLEEINAACKADKERGVGTLRNIHKWFAPMPLPAWRALLFAALVDDPEDDNQRVYLLDLIKRLVAKRADLPASADLDEAKALVARAYPQGTPTVFDPFCGGGSTLVEAQRLGLETFGSDLNPIPTLISRTLTQLLPPAYGRQPLHGEAHTATKVRGKSSAPETLALGDSTTVRRTYVGYEGIVRDVSHYAEEVMLAAWDRVAPHYPMAAGEKPLAWLWARTATCPNPTCGVETVLTTSWWLSKKKGDLAWIEPSVDEGVVAIKVVSNQRSGGPTEATKSARGATFRCLGCSNPVKDTDLDKQVRAGGLGLRMTAVVAEAAGRRYYREPTQEEVVAAQSVDLSGVDVPDSVPASDGGSRNRFGLATQADLYLPRQMLTLSVMSDLIRSTRSRVMDDGGDEQWADLITTMLGLALGGLAITGSTQTRWRDRVTGPSKAEPAFGRNDLPVTWDFAETFFMGGAVGDWLNIVRRVTAATKYTAHGAGIVVRADARTSALPSPGLVATDPPYFDAIAYADLSDYFYVWHRRALRDIHPDLYQTVATPKTGELTALPSQHGSKRDAARTYFIDGFTETFENLKKSAHPDLPMLVVYASKEQKGGRDEETRWSSILTAMMRADLEIVGTWPIHGTGSTRMIGLGANAVASYIVMVCRPRDLAANTSSVTDFNRALRRELGPAIRDLQAASILPVDLAQAAMGPGMQIFSRYRAVLDQSGRAVPVEQALHLINAALSEVLDEQEGELDPESRFAVRWWESHAWSSASFGEADKTARPLGISVDDVVRAQVASSHANRVQLNGDGALDRAWTPGRDSAPTAWEAVHHLADRLIDGGGELEAAKLMARLGPLQDSTMALTYRLHDIAAKKGRTVDQERYNALINSWAELVRLSGDGATTMEELF
ncbi:DUF1156 domain-containing protein [Pseudactinotalea sp. Z1732]|uniref:DUF1156 domain-containing protein n=1 Tax=Micrococcales TaxID=85006 RepID=UPI003C7CAC66